MTSHRENFVNWRKSSHSGNDLDCVEAGHAPGRVGVADSKRPNGPILEFGASEWSRFLAHVKQTS